MRACDFVARWGGEEFVVCLTSTDSAGGHIKAERVRAVVEAMVVLGEDGARIPVTVSIGLAARASGESLDAVVARADHAMYAAKQGGRNRVESAAAGPVSANRAVAS
jgi:diguanylate cyclase (GGDEF)-like protein